MISGSRRNGGRSSAPRKVLAAPALVHTRARRQLRGARRDASAASKVSAASPTYLARCAAGRGEVRGARRWTASARSVSAAERRSACERGDIAASAAVFGRLDGEGFDGVAQPLRRWRERRPQAVSVGVKPNLG